MITIWTMLHLDEAKRREGGSIKSDREQAQGGHSRERAEVRVERGATGGERRENGGGLERARVQRLGER